ncbi:unnamed protein product [Periconia digitata]|uniref:Uncharacterized protein n=1 Tax=Periconia digitata TaxID=1303443 RepID=A0A9W4UI40_9PLEO|nr:unnamed protein product [Periconia digitata]
MFHHAINCTRPGISITSNVDSPLPLLLHQLNMDKSRYAPRTPSAISTPLDNLKQTNEEKLKAGKEKAARLLVRVQWKAETLMDSYIRAVNIVIAHEQDGFSNGYPDQKNASNDSRGRQAESMFKVDFFEFYTLLERFISACLETFNIYISGTPPQTNVNALRFVTNPGLAKSRPEASHAYHANLLEALEKESCPLHQSLGNSEVRTQLGLAKDFRNAWKDVDAEKSSDSHNHHQERRNIRLQDLNLQKMLESLVLGCIQAHSVMQGRSGPELSHITSKDFVPTTYGADTDMEDIPFEYMDDAMDLD